MKSIISLLLLSSVLSLNVFSQNQLLTIAESSNFTATSTYADVMGFVKDLDQRYDHMKLVTIASSTEGREIPMLIIGSPLPESPKDLENDPRMVVYLQANIHAGEIEGKEATLMLARDDLSDPNAEIFKDLVVLINPILNADGNERFSKKNRTNQNGPSEGVGVRYNGQQLDLNRDAVKIESPEIRGVISNVFNTWDPAIIVDCHTTNGSFHEEPVTFTWMVNPNGDRSLINYMRDEMMPAVGDRLRNTYGVENCFYGVFIDRMDYSKGWISYASEPRYLVDYVGLRNRLAILNENYVYADYETRVRGSYAFLKSVLDYAGQHYKQIKELLAAADKQTIARGMAPKETDSMALRYKAKPTPQPITIKAIETDTIPGVKGYWRYKASDRKVTVTVPYYADYYATESTRFPYAYILSIADATVLDLLEVHGIEYEYLSKDMALEVEGFKIQKLTPSKRLNQGHYTHTIEGNYATEQKDFYAGSILIKTGQKLGSLVACIMEARANDGLLKWNFFDRYLVSQWGGRYYPFPVYRIVKPVKLPTHKPEK